MSAACLRVSGPTRKLPPSASAVDFFQLFVPDSVLKGMVVQTNMYARKFQERFGSDGAWVEVTLAEMKAFLGYVISTSVSHCESVLSIWSGGFYSNRSLALAMSQARFEKILKYFHVVAFRSSQATHGLYKVQPFLDALQSSFEAAFRPSQTQVSSLGRCPRPSVPDLAGPGSALPTQGPSGPSAVPHSVPYAHVDWRGRQDGSHHRVGACCLPEGLLSPSGTLSPVPWTRACSGAGGLGPGQQRA